MSKPTFTSDWLANHKNRDKLIGAREVTTKYHEETITYSPRLRPAVSEPAERSALVTPSEREKPRQERAERCHCHRYRITYTIFAVRPMDFDNIAIKKIQDELVHQNFLPDDNWKVLEGTVISRKADSKKDQRTEILIEQL